MSEILRLYCYGNPNAVDITEEDWACWRQFIDRGLSPIGEQGTVCHTSWHPESAEHEEKSLYAYVAPFRSIVHEIDFAKAEDWRIETHLDLLPLAKNIILRREKDRQDREARWKALGEVL